jgi:hypothetical protein
VYLLLSDDKNTATLYRDVEIGQLGRTRLRVALSRAYLLSGEWLRRANRRPWFTEWNDSLVIDLRRSHNNATTWPMNHPGARWRDKFPSKYKLALSFCPADRRSSEAYSGHPVEVQTNYR